MTIDQITENEDDLFDRGDDEEERSGGYRERPWWWLKDEGQIAYLRFMEESPDWRKVPTHRFFPTKPEPQDHEGKWPLQMGGTCRNGRLSARFPQGCAICTSGYQGEYKKGSVADDVRYTFAIEREQYEDPDTKRKKYRDKEVEVPAMDGEGNLIEGETITLPSVVMVGETMYKMMSEVKATGEAFGSLRGRDMRLKLIKNPSGKKGLIVQTIPMDPEPTIQPGTDHWQIYQHAVKLWKPGGLVLSREILYRASDDWWNQWFLMDDGRTFAEHQIAKGVSPAAQPTASVSTASPAPPDAERLAAMKARITAIKAN